MKIISTLIVIFCILSTLFASPYHVEPTLIKNQTIKIDGYLNDAIWKKVTAYEDFHTFQPVYGEKMSKPTYVYTAYDENNLYFAFKCIDDDPNNIIGTLTKRDNIFSEDWVMVMLDSYNDQESCYEFGVNAYGVQGDLMFSGNGDDPSHDFIWESAGRKTNRGYNVEMAIPLKSIRFKPADEVEMGICFLRYDPRNSEKGSYPKFDPEGGALLNQFTKVRYKNLKYNQNIEILPSVTQNLKYENEAGDLTKAVNQNEIGVTSKIGLTPTLTLDATYNPDFSQIEADAGQVTKNLRTDIYYREKRPFFLEGSEKFQLAGARNFSAIGQAVYTRKIIDPIAGVKLSGKIGQKGSLSSLIAVDESPKNDEDLVNKNAYHGIIRYKQLLNDGSYFGGLLTSKYLGNELINTLAGDARYYFDGKNKVEANGIISTHNTANASATQASHNIDLAYSYNDEKYNFTISGHDISKDFQMASGFFGRDGMRSLANIFSRNFYPKNSVIKKYNLGYIAKVSRDLYDHKNEYFIELQNGITLPRNSYFSAWIEMGTEVYDGNIYKDDGLGFFFRSQLFKQLNIRVIERIGRAVWYDEDAPQQAIKTNSEFSLDYKPNSRFQSSFSFVRAYYKSNATKKELMDYQIYRNRTTYQLNKYLFIRSTVEYNAYDKQLLADFLASFTYIPGTVIHVGYGAMFERTQWNRNSREYSDADQFLEMDRGLFVKAAYNWRL